MADKNFKKNKITKLINYTMKGMVASLITLPMIQSSYAAEESAAAKANDDIEKIEVRGIRGSVTKSLNIKRFETNFVDAISAEDVGKLPDRNIAEALQRVPGVAIQRDRGEGDFVSIRGLSPDFVRGSVNGRTLVSGTESFDSTINGGAASTTGRATNFDVLPSEIINVLEVYKSASAEHVEGGIGGVVNIKTARPMQLGNKTAGSLRGQYSDFSEDTEPSGSLLHSFVNDDESFGAMLSLSVSNRSIREDLGNSFGYANGTVFGGAFNTTLDTTGDGVGDTDPDKTFAPFSANPEIFTEDRERNTLNGALQWRLEDTEIVVDALYSKREIESTQYGAIYSLLPNSQAGVGFCNVPANDDGSYTCPSAVVQNDSIVSFPVTSNIESFTDQREGEDKSVNLAVNIEHTMEKWTFTGDLSYAKAEGSIDFGRSVFSYVNDVVDSQNQIRTISGTASTLNDVVSFTPDVSDSLLQSSENYAIQQTELRQRENTDEETALQFDALYDTGAEGITEIKMGLRWGSREKTFVEYMGNNGGRNNPVLASSIPNAFVTAPNNFLDGNINGLTPSQLLFPNHDVILNSRGADIELSENTLGTFDAKEDTLAGYVQLNLDTEIGDMNLSGNAGIRVVKTDVDVAGKSQSITLEQQGSISLPVLSGEVERFPFDNSYTNFLPSLNLKLDITDDLLSRFSYSKTVTRPEFSQLAPSLNIINATQRIAAFGNPNLTPYTSDNVDLSIEWYFEESSAITVSTYYKEIDDYIVASTNTDIEIAGITFNSVSQPDNQGKATISGIEVGYTQAFSFLPEPFDGLGLVVNLTTVNAELELNSGEEISFPGISDTSVNSAIYYDKGDVQARLAYSWRDDFLLVPQDVFVNSEIWTKAYGQFDFTFNYKINDNFNVFVEAINFTDKKEKIYTTSTLSSGDGVRPLSYGQVGRKIGAGITFSF